MRWSCSVRAALAAVAVIFTLAASSSVALASDTLLGGQTLGPGQTLASGDGHYLLAMQTDGNLVLYVMNGSSIHRAVWSTGTHGDNGARAVLQSNGNLVLFSPVNEALWSSNTSGVGCANLVVQDDGNLVMYAGKHNVWSTHTVATTLQPGDELVPGQRIFSPGGEHFVVYMQTDGNLVLYGPTGALWSSGTWGIPGNHAIMQTDGNLVVYTTAGRALWSSGTHGDSGAYAAVQQDANFVVYHKGKGVWSSGTAGKAPNSGKSQWSVPAFVACPPPAPPPAATGPPSAPVVKVPVASKLRRLRVRVTMSWTWDRAHTRLYRIKIPHLPRRATVLVWCRGRGCPRHVVIAGRRRLGRLLHSLDGQSYRAGDRLLVTIYERGRKTERITIGIRYGRLPRVRLL